MDWQAELWLKSRQLQNAAGKVKLPRVNLPNVPNQMWLQGQRFLPNASKLADIGAERILTSDRLRSLRSWKGGLAGAAISAALDKPMRQTGAWGGKHIAKGLVEAFVSNEEKQQFRKDFPSLYGKAGPDLPRQGEGAISYLTARSNAEKAVAEATDTATTTVAPREESTTTNVSEQSRHAANTGVDAMENRVSDWAPEQGGPAASKEQAQRIESGDGTALYWDSSMTEDMPSMEMKPGADIPTDAAITKHIEANTGPQISAAQGMQIAAVIADSLFNKEKSGPVQGKSFQAPKETPGGYTGGKMAHADVWRMGNYHATAPWRWG